MDPLKGNYTGEINAETKKAHGIGSIGMIKGMFIDGA